MTPTGASPRFATTRWTVIVAARGTGGDARAALETLCAAYWYPLYAFARRKGHPPEDAQDLVQGLFEILLRRRSFATADPARGRFRTFLLTAFERHASRERRRAAAAKRGGGRRRVPFEMDDGERRYSMEPADDRTPELLFERRWALALLGRAIERLRTEDGSDPRRIDALLPHCGGPGDAKPYADLAAQLGITEGAVKAAVRRLRSRCREILRDEVAHTVAHAGEIDDEVRGLLAAL